MASAHIQFWLLSMDDSYKPITSLEEDVAKMLSYSRRKEYRVSRGEVRGALSELFGVPPLDIPLEAPPGKPPLLKNGWGKINFSHCGDALLVGWSDKNIGVDIERIDRKFDAKSLVKRFYCKEEVEMLESFHGDKLRSNALKLWVLKESAIKWQKGSIAIDLPKWMITKDLKKAVHKELEIELPISCYIYKSWLIGIAGNSQSLTPNSFIRKI